MHSSPISPVVNYKICTVADMPADSVVVSVPEVDTWASGINPGGNRHDSEPYSGAVALLLLLIALLAFMSSQVRRICANLDTDLLGVRRRANAFDEHTSSESRALLIMVLLCCVSEAVLLGGGINDMKLGNGVYMLLMFALTIGLYLFQTIAYTVVGYTFTDHNGMHQWLKGFNLSQGLLGISLALPAITSLYYPGLCHAMAIVGIVLYILMRIAFLCKGFRIFYNNLSSIVYFILYLCAVEFVPVIILVGLALAINGMT